MKKINLDVLQEKARLITIKELEKYIFPHELYQYMALDILLDNKKENIFILHIPGQSGKQSIIISKTRMNLYTGEGIVEYIGLDSVELKKKKAIHKKNSINQNLLGKVIAIPTQNKLYIPAQVVYISDIFHNLILLGIYYNPTRFISKVPLAPEFSNQFLKLIYTSLAPIKNEQWLTIGLKENKLSSQTLARRIVDNELWLNDTRIRTATESDKKLFDMMEVKSKEEVEYMLAGYFN